MMNEIERALMTSPIPDYMHKGLVDYIQNGHPPGGFLIAILTNDLKNAATAADGNNRRLLYDYVSFLYNYAPAPCWGSPAAVKDWVTRGGLVGVKEGAKP